MAALPSFEEIKGGRYLPWVAGMLPASALRQDVVQKIFAIVLASSKYNCILSETLLQIFEFCITVIKKTGTDVGSAAPAWQTCCLALLTTVRHPPWQPPPATSRTLGLPVLGTPGTYCIFSASAIGVQRDVGWRALDKKCL